jgi:hypothetical protein
MILTRNMLSTLGSVNGTRLRLLSDVPPDGSSLPVLHVETVGMGEPRQFFLPRIIFELTTPGVLKFVRRQFPVRLAYAFTSNKAQGQTIIKCVYDKGHENFSHGTAYVANSRTTGFAALGFLHAPLPEDDPGGRPTFVNFVLQRALAQGGTGCAHGRGQAARADARRRGPGRRMQRGGQRRRGGGRGGGGGACRACSACRACRAAARAHARHASSALSEEDGTHPDGAAHRDARERTASTSK